jgi:hypothetical protein
LFHGVYPHPPAYQQVALPATDRACAEEAIWLRQSMLLGDLRDMDDIVAAMCKIQQHCDELRE